MGQAAEQIGTVVADGDIQAIADAEIPEIREEARAWLTANNSSDQMVIVGFATVLALLAAALQTWWALALAVSLLFVLPFRWMAAPHFRRGEIRRGILWANAGTWYLAFPVVVIAPDALAIQMQNVIGPMVLAAAYLERRLVSRLVPIAVAVAVAISIIGFTTDGFVGDVAPRWLYVTALVFFVAANLLLVIGDIREVNVVRLRFLQRAVRSNREIEAADRALRESRRRLLVAADEERIRLERNLHDGAQQRIVSLAMQLRLAADLAEEGHQVTSAELFEMHRAATEAVDELRDLAQGVYPARLRELGLAKALHGVARRSPVTIEIDDRLHGALEAEIEVALYFVCVEAIQNATKHGRPDTIIRIVLDASAGDLCVTVTDDGPGFTLSDRATSRGLLNMDDRVGALGGEFTIDTEPGRGTVVTARIPRSVALAGAAGGPVVVA